MADATEEPDVRTRVLNGVAVPSVEPERGRDFQPEHERASIDVLRRAVRRGDEVVVVGGGWGASAVVAARMTHFEGRVTVFEPSSEMVRTIERAIRVNAAAECVEVEHAAIGPVPESNERLFGPADGERLPPDAVPACDVLELDCEGAELAILEALDHRPRVVVAETHPHLDAPASRVRSALEDGGYAVEQVGTAGADDSLPVLCGTLE